MPMYMSLPELGAPFDALQRRYGVPAIDLSRYEVPSDVASLLPTRLARELLALPIAASGDTVVVAMADPADTDALATLQSHLKYTVSVVVSPRDLLVAAIEQAGSSGRRQN